MNTVVAAVVAAAVVVATNPRRIFLQGRRSSWAPPFGFSADAWLWPLRCRLVWFVNRLSGAQDDARYFQISVPVQPGNSGGALVDERGNVVGVVSAKLSARAALASSGALPENVNYAVKSSYLLSFLESVPEVSEKLKEPETKERKFEEVVKAAEQAAVLVLVY